MTKIIVFSDLHLDAVERPGRPDSRNRLRRALDHAGRNHPDAAFYVICGDLVDRGDAASYAILREEISKADAPVAMMLGNHDDRETYFATFPDAPRDKAGYAQQVIELPEARLIMLDTLAHPYSADQSPYGGRLCPDRLAWLESALAASEKPAVIFMHHPPHDTGLVTMDRHKLQDGDAFFDVIGGAPVSQLICGHVHRTVSGSTRGVPFSIFKSLGAHQFPMICDPIERWVEVSEPVGYGAVLLTEDSVLVHSEDFETTDIEYALRTEHSAATL